MSALGQDQVVRVGDLNDAGDDGDVSADAVFALVIAACLIVDAALVGLVVEICDRFMLPRFPFVIAGLLAAVVVPFSVATTLRGRATQLHEHRPSIRRMATARLSRVLCS